MLSLSKLATRDTMILVLASATIYGISWGLIYLIFSALHGMPEMFNDEFIWILAGILDIQLNTIWEGFLLAFFEGSLLGFIFGLFLLRIYRKNDDKS